MSRYPARLPTFVRPERPCSKCGAPERAEGRSWCYRCTREAANAVTRSKRALGPSPETKS